MNINIKTEYINDKVFIKLSIYVLSSILLCKSPGDTFIVGMCTGDGSLGSNPQSCSACNRVADRGRRLDGRLSGYIWKA
jgi:hypothetical protein